MKLKYHRLKHGGVPNAIRKKGLVAKDEAFLRSEI